MDRMWPRFLAAGWFLVATSAAFGQMAVGVPQAPAAPAAVAQPCSTGTCTTGCDPCAGRCDPCCFCNWQVYGDFLFIRPRSTEIPYAVPIDGAIGAGAAPVQIGRTGIVDPDYEPAFRVGFARALDDCASIGASYTYFRSDTADTIDAGNGLLRAMVLHPGTPDAAADYLTANANFSIDYDLADIDYRHVFIRRDNYCVNWLLGLRYAHIGQEFNSEFIGQVREVANTEITFDGGGIRVGLEGQRINPCNGLLVYGKGAASFVAGEFNANYFQGSDQDPSIVDTSYKAGRVITMLDFELGAGWQSSNGRIRLTAGYMVNSWMNMLKTADYIRGVQANDYRGLDFAGENTMTFDGFVTRAEYRW